MLRTRQEAAGARRRLPDARHSPGRRPWGHASHAAPIGSDSTPFASTSVTHMTPPVRSPRPSTDATDEDGALRVLVTGATGYVGSRLVPELLAAGHTVVAASRSGTQKFPWDDEVETREFDIEDDDLVASAVDGVDAVIYLVHSMKSPRTQSAGIARLPSGWRRPASGPVCSGSSTWPAWSRTASSPPPSFAVRGRAGLPQLRGAHGRAARRDDHRGRIHVLRTVAATDQRVPFFTPVPTWITARSSPSPSWMSSTSSAGR